MPESRLTGLRRRSTPEVTTGSESMSRDRRGAPSRNNVKKGRPAAVYIATLLLLSAAACTSAADSSSTTEPAVSAERVETSIAATTTVGTALPTTSDASAHTTTETADTTTTTVLVLDEPLWTDVSGAAIGASDQWSNKVELADIDGDGDVDILFADGGEFSFAGPPVVNQVLINDGSGVFEDRSVEVFGDTGDLARAIKVRDLNGDGHPDIFVATTFESQSRLFLGGGGLVFEEVTETHLPRHPASVGDAEIGDVDADGDLDIVLADWGPGNPDSNAGAPPVLWLNDGSGSFIDAEVGQIPDVAVQWSFELELIDVDNDYDLDIAIACKRCTGSFLLINDGAGVFQDASANLPQYANNYDFEVIDLNGDGNQDLITVNDGPRLTEHVFLGDGSGTFVDATPDLWRDDANSGLDDNMVTVLDFDSDGDPDFLIAQLGTADRIMVNDGTGRLAKLSDVFDGQATNGTLDIAVADLNGDDILDVVQAQGERARDNRVYLGDALLPDTAPPVISGVVGFDGVLHARVHDNKTPVAHHDWQRVYATGPEGEVELAWYGEALWRAAVPVTGDYQVCAIDRASNRTCAEQVTVVGS